MISAWLDLLLAGILEVVWSTCLKESHGFSSLPWSVATIAGMLASFWFLAHAVKVLPLGTSYVIWTGRGMIACYIVNKRKDLPTFGRTEKEETSEAEETRQLLTGLLSGVSRKIQGKKKGAKNYEKDSRNGSCSCSRCRRIRLCSQSVC